MLFEEESIMPKLKGFGLLSTIFRADAEDKRKEMEHILKEADKSRDSAEEKHTNNYMFAKTQLDKLEKVKRTAWKDAITVFIGNIEEIKNINLSGYDLMPVLEKTVTQWNQIEPFRKTETSFKEDFEVEVFANLFRIDSAPAFVSMLKAGENLEKAKEYAAKMNYETERIKTKSRFFYRLGKLAETYSAFIEIYTSSCIDANSKLVVILNKAREEQSRKIINKIKEILNMSWKINFKYINKSDQQTIQVIYLMNQILYKVLKQPLLSSKGNIVDNADSELDSAKQTAKMLPLL